MGDTSACIICLDTSPPPIQLGCACRGDSGLAHIACLVEVAASQRAHRGVDAWTVCQTCKQDFTGAMQRGLAEAWRSRVAEHEAAESAERLFAESTLAKSLLDEGKYVQAEPMLRKLHKVYMRMFGPEHPNSLTTAAHLASSLSGQGKFVDAERIDREVLGAQKRALGLEHPDTLAAAGNLAGSLSRQRKYAEAEAIQREVLIVLKRILGHEHPKALATAGNLAVSLSCQGKQAEAEAIQRELLGAQRRVLGQEHPHTLRTANDLATTLSRQNKHDDAEAMKREVMGVLKRVLGSEHPDTLAAANNLATTLSHQHKYAEAEQMLQFTLASCQRVLGPSHPDTLATATNLEICSEILRARIRPKPPTKPAAQDTAIVASPLPAGTRVLVQRLVAKPEHNGKLARVLSFDARTGRYAVAVDDGRELSLKADCVARAGCAAAGCASEEASSVCARCQAVRYCSRECQRGDWKAHKAACLAAQPAAS
jgi:tetratricopeptide (TPR) repeat protein